MSPRRHRSVGQVLPHAEQAPQPGQEARYSATDYPANDYSAADYPAARYQEAEYQEAEYDAPVGPQRLVTRRRMLRWTLLVTAGILAVLACWQDPVYAHDGVKLTLHHDGRGSVWIDTSWSDGHPITDPISATLSARERAGSTVLPVALSDLKDGKGSARYQGTLKDGTWTVTVDVAKPGAGTCTAILVVGGAEGAPESVLCDDVAPATQVAAASANGAGYTSTMALLIGAGVVAVLFALVAAATFRRRTSTPV